MKSPAPVFTLLAVVSISTLLLLEGLYWYGLRVLPENTAPSKSNYSEDLLYAQWVESKGHGDIEMQGIYPVQFIIAFASFNENNLHWSSPKSLMLASQNAKLLLLNRGDDNKVHRHWHLNTIATAVWISRNWTAQEALNTLLDGNYYGNRFFGVREAAKGYFDKMPDALTQEEILFLVALSRGGSYYNPWCRPRRSKGLLKRMNHLSELLSRYYPKRYVSAVQMKSLPASLLRKKCEMN